MIHSIIKGVHVRLNTSLYISYYVSRLTPVFMVTYAIFTTLTDALKPSPFIMPIEQFDETCSTEWWRHLLYVQNLFDTNFVRLTLSIIFGLNFVLNSQQ